MKFFKGGRICKRLSKIKRYSSKFKVLKKGLRYLTKGLRDPKKVNGKKEDNFQCSSKELCGLKPFKKV